VCVFVEYIFIMMIGLYRAILYYRGGGIGRTAVWVNARERRGSGCGGGVGDEGKKCVSARRAQARIGGGAPFPSRPRTARSAVGQGSEAFSRTRPRAAAAAAAAAGARSTQPAW